MSVSYAIDHTTARDAVPKILDVLSGALTDVVGLIFALYLTVGLACVLLAYLQRAAKRPAARAALVAAVTLLVCIGPLIRLWPEVREQTPRAYLLAALLGLTFPLLSRALPGQSGPDIHDRRVDYLVGLLLLGAAGFVLTAVPARVGVSFWTSHADLVAAPVALAGAVTLVFGTQALRRLWVPLILAVACLAPLPEGVVRVVADVSAAPVLRVVRSGNDSAAVSFEGAVAGAAGFLAIAVLVALSLACAVRPTMRRIALVSGLCCTLVALRLVLAFVTASVFGPAAASGVLGPGADCATLGLLLAGVGIVTARSAAQRHTDPARPPARQNPVMRPRLALTVLLVAAVSIAALGMSGAARSSYARIALGAELARNAPTRADMSTSESAGGSGSGSPDGSATSRAQAESGRQAEASMWRVPLTGSTSGAAAVPVVLDLLTVPDPADRTALSAAVVEDCYGLEPAGLPTSAELGTGVYGLHRWWVDTAGDRFQLLTWREPGRSTLWVTLLSPASDDRSAPIPEARFGPCADFSGAGAVAADPPERAAAPQGSPLPASVAARLYHALAVHVAADATES